MSARPTALRIIGLASPNATTSTKDTVNTHTCGSSLATETLFDDGSNRMTLSIHFEDELFLFLLIGVNIRIEPLN